MHQPQFLPGIPKNADMQLNKDNTLNDNRRVSLQVDFEENGKIYNIGYNGINQEKGDTYNFYLFAKFRTNTASDGIHSNK